MHNSRAASHVKRNTVQKCSHHHSCIYWPRTLYCAQPCSPYCSTMQASEAPNFDLGNSALLSTAQVMLNSCMRGRADETRHASPWLPWWAPSWLETRNATSTRCPQAWLSWLPTPAMIRVLRGFTKSGDSVLPLSSNISLKSVVQRRVILEA